MIIEEGDGMVNESGDDLRRYLPFNLRNAGIKV